MGRAMSVDHVSSAISDTAAQAEVLNERQRKAVVVRLFERLGVDVTSRAPWDDKAAPDGKLRPDGRELIPRYVDAAACLMFMGGAHAIWKFRCGSDLLRVLKRCPAREFYVYDEDASYLLCSNHHDFLIGWGAASPWVERLSNPQDG
jgi:hypothetical protein